MKPWSILAVGILVLALAGCNFGSVNVERAPEGGVDVTVTLTQEEVNTLLNQVLANATDIRFQDGQVDLQSGSVVITGNVARDDGSTVPGSMTLALGVAGGQMTIEVTSMSIDGFDAKDERIARLNDQIREALSARARRDNANTTVQINSVTVTDDALTMVLNVQRASS